MVMLYENRLGNQFSLRAGIFPALYLNQYKGGKNDRS
jgi:hypothetical protein